MCVICLKKSDMWKVPRAFSFFFFGLKQLVQLTYILTFACGQMGEGEGGRWGCFVALTLAGSAGWFHLCACVTKSCSEPLTCERQPLISSSSKVTRPPRPRARCHNTPSFSLSSPSDAPVKCSLVQTRAAAIDQPEETLVRLIGTFLSAAALCFSCVVLGPPSACPVIP